MKGLVAVLVAMAAVGALAFAEDVRLGNGLETAGDYGVHVVVDALSDDALAVALNADAIALKCEQVLSAAGLVVMDEAAWKVSPSGSELRVSVNVQGYRYSCTARFERRLGYTAGGTAYEIEAPVWERTTGDRVVSHLSYTGPAFFNWNKRSHEPGQRVGHAAYMIDALVALLNEFCADFLAANPRRAPGEP